MRIISRRALRDFAAEYPQSKGQLEAWYRRVLHVDWETPADVKNDYGTADILPDHRVVFNIAGNHYRLIARINYRSKAVYIRFIGTHSDYDKIDATTI